MTCTGHTTCSSVSLTGFRTDSFLTKTKQTDLSRNKRNASNVSMYIIQRTGGTIAFKNEPRELNRALALAAQTNENSTTTAHSKKKLIHSGFELMTLSSRRNRFLNMNEAQFLKRLHTFLIIWEM